jgi:ABC-type lipoprotein export system ATPase subunit
VATRLGHRFAGTDWLFRDVSFELVPGTVTALCGPSGCGKSTLLSILAGWDEPVVGSVQRNRVHSVGWVFQNPHGVANRNALDHVVFPLLARGWKRSRARGRALEVLGLFGLSEVAGRSFASLSGGEAQRLMLARAVCLAPDLLLVDEPTAQLDARTAQTVNDRLSHVADSGSMVVIATHDAATRAGCSAVVDLLEYSHGIDLTASNRLSTPPAGMMLKRGTN